MARQKVKDDLYFNMQAAIHNRDMQRKRLEGKYLYYKLAHLTGKKDGREIMAVIEQWKRVAEATKEIFSAMEWYERKLILDNDKKKKRKKKQACLCCGRIYHGPNYSKHFGPNKICKLCKERWDEHRNGKGVTSEPFQC